MVICHERLSYGWVDVRCFNGTKFPPVGQLFVVAAGVLWIGRTN